MSTMTYLGETASPVCSDTLAEDTHTGVELAEKSVARRALTMIEAGEEAIHRWLLRHSIAALRISMGAVIFGFGILKYFPGVSPAQDLVLTTTRALTFGLVPSGVALVLLATVECAIGLLLISGRWLRVTTYLVALWVLGILSPIVVLTGRMFAGPHHMPTLEGQYVLKDVILLTAAMVIATTMRRAAHRGGREAD
ncbi:MAG: hypothetical protein ACRDS0_03515 [Pseudonocardiaceae bacterium]